jgi:glycosyltransferase involved in cell wall biosynthesis
MGPARRTDDDMYRDKRVVVVMPAYNAARTLVKTYEGVMEHGIVDLVIVVDDASADETVALAQTLPNVRVHVHENNRGYGGNQKSCYRLALAEDASIVIMVHPDYQYTPRLIPAMTAMVATDLYGAVLGSRILGGRALAGGMPRWRYAGNRILTFVQNALLGAKPSEYHTGYRAFSRGVLERLPLEANSEGFDFDAEILAQLVWFGYVIGEVSCPTRYAGDASSLGFWGSVSYGVGCIRTAVGYRLARWGVRASPLFPDDRGPARP